MKILISSISDCREKNGVVTFMNIMRSNAAFFKKEGFILQFCNFVDFAPAKPDNHAPQITAKAVSEPSVFVKTRRRVRALLSHNATGSFVMMAAILMRRGWIAAWKGRRQESNATIHFYQDAFTAFFGLFFHRKSSTKILLLHSGNDSLNQVFMHFPGMRGTFYERLIRHQFSAVLGAVDSIVTLNNAYAELLREKYPGKSISTVYNTSPFSLAATTHSTSTAAPGKIRLVAVGSLQHIKGFDLLVAGAAQLDQYERSQLHISIVGGGSEFGPLSKILEAEGLQDVVSLEGESSKVSDFLRVANGFLLTSRDEGFPIALIEAAGFSLPVVSTRVGSIPEVFGQDGCFYIDTTSDSIAAALKSIVHRRIDLTGYGRRSQQIFREKLSLEHFLASYVDLFKRAGGEHAG